MEAAERGDAIAQSNLGGMYLEGRGVPQDYSEAVKWFRKAVEQGSASAQSHLGLMYAKGQGVAQDYSKARTWWCKAAEQGHPIAQSNLGFMYAKGLGVPQDDEQAHMWLNLATSILQPGKNRDRCLAARDAIARRMTPAEIAEAQRLAREWKWK